MNEMDGKEARAMIYEDTRGWLYKVMPGIGDNTYKARYRKAGTHRWKGVTVLPWRETEAKAEADLKAYAERKGMLEVE